MVGSRGVYSMLVGDDFPEFGTDFCGWVSGCKCAEESSPREERLLTVTALSGLNVNDLSHFI